MQASENGTDEKTKAIPIACVSTEKSYPSHYDMLSK